MNDTTPNQTNRDTLIKTLLELCATAGELRSSLSKLPGSRALAIAETHFDTLDLAVLDLSQRITQEELEVTVTLALTSLRAAQLWTDAAIRSAKETHGN